MPVTSDLVASILARLSEPARLPYVKAFEQIPAPLTQRRDEAFQATMRALHNRCPFVLVATDDVRNITGKTGGTAQEWRCDLDVLVYCGGDHRGSMVDGRLDPDAVALEDPSADQGLRQLMEDVFAALAGWAPVTSSARMNPVRGSWVIVDPAMTVWAWTFSVDVLLLSQPMVPRKRYTSFLVDNQTDSPPAIIASEELP